MRHSTSEPMAVCLGVRKVFICPSWPHTVKFWKRLYQSPNGYGGITFNPLKNRFEILFGYFSFPTLPQEVDNDAWRYVSPLYFGHGADGLGGRNNLQGIALPAWLPLPQPSGSPMPVWKPSFLSAKNSLDTKFVAGFCRRVVIVSCSKISVPCHAKYYTTQLGVVA